MSWEESADSLDLVLAEETDHSKVLARIPDLFGISPKATYLAYRAMGLSTEDALIVLDFDEEALDYWEKSDPRFLEFSSEHLIELQATVGPELIRMGFMRNMALFISQDAKLLRKAMIGGLEALTKQEYNYYSKVRSHYSAGDLLAIEKALGNVKEEKMVINLSWGPEKRIVEETVEGDFRVLRSIENEEDSD